MNSNFYYDELSVLFKKAEALNDEALWNTVYSAVKKMEPDRSNSILYKKITQCFEKLEAESESDKSSLLFLSFLFNITENIKYFEKFISLCAQSEKIPNSSKLYLYNYCCLVMKERLYFNTEKTAAALNNLFEAAFSAARRFLREDINSLSPANSSKNALFVASSFGEYPFGAVKHMLDVADYLMRLNYSITVIVTHEKLFENGKINLNPVPVYNPDTAQNTDNAISILKSANKSIKIYELNYKNAFVPEVKNALNIVRSTNPQAIMNFTGTSVFTQLLAEKYQIAGFHDLSPNERPEIQKISAGLLKRAEKLAAANNYGEVTEILLKVYKMLRNNTGKAAILEQLIRAYAECGETEKMADAARVLIENYDNGEFSDVCALAYAARKESKNAIFLREKIYKADKTALFNNLKLFELYITEKMYYKAEEMNSAIKTEPNSETETLRHLFYYKTFREDEAIFHLKESLRLARESNNLLRLVENSLISITSSLYYGFFSDDEYVQIINGHYNGRAPVKENAFKGYKPKKNAIKVGFASGAVANHPVGYFISSLFKEKNEGGNFEYYFYDASGYNPDMSLTNRIKENAHHYADIYKLNPGEAAEVILKDKLDILIDLNGLSDKSIWNILINRLAPVQMTWIGFPCSLPIKNMDYNIADNITDPPGIAEKFYTEKLMRLPKTFLCYGITEAKEVEEAPFIKNGYVTFGSFNNGNKFSNKILKIWASVLNGVKNARLIIRSKDNGNEYTKIKLMEKFEKNGIDISRTQFLPETDRIDYYYQYNTIDIILDTYPFNGATTTCDAFLMSTPIISLYGNRHVSRVGLSMLTNIGFAELAVKTEEEYVNMAVKLCGDFKLLREITSSIREKALASALFNHVLFKQDFEQTLYNTYQNHFGETGEGF
ncbi:MAG: hypothetical protein LBS21_00460 [Clostridiales bacterium]|nr:hypothetical protein [Clostridiales bacterium]